jgi:hypothetical protein
MTTSKNADQQVSLWQHNIRSGATAIEGLRRAQFRDHSIVEETYELTPSGD